MDVIQTLLKKSFVKEVVNVEVWKELLKKSIVNSDQLDAVCKGDVRKEIIAEVIKKYPQGNKVPDAQLKQAFSFIALDDANSAKLLLGKIINQYPDSDQAAIAQEKIKSLK